MPDAGIPAFRDRHGTPVDRLRIGGLDDGIPSDDQRSPRLVPLPALTYTYETNPEGVEAWKAINRADRTIPIVFGNPYRTQRVHTPKLFAAAEDLSMRDYAKRFGRQNALMTSLSAAGATVVQWCSLYRPDADDVFSRGEIVRCNRWMAHLGEALRINRLLQTSDADLDGECAALVERDGLVLASRPEFAALMQRHWREYDDYRMPAVVVRQIATMPHSSLRMRHGVLHVRRIADLWWMTIGPPPSRQRLPPRQMDVAMLYAQGHTHKTIARTLGIAPSTVRNHIAATYRTLNVSSRQGLRAEIDPVD